MFLTLRREEMKGGERAPRTLAGLSTPSCEFRDLDFDITPVGVWRVCRGLPYSTIPRTLKKKKKNSCHSAPRSPQGSEPVIDTRSHPQGSVGFPGLIPCFSAVIHLLYGNRTGSGLKSKDGD